MVDIFEVNHYIRFIEKDYKNKIRIGFSWEPVFFSGYVSIACDCANEYFTETIIVETTQDAIRIVNECFSRFLTILAKKEVYI